MGNDTQNNEEQLEMLLMTLGEVEHGICLFRSENQAEWVSAISKRMGKEKVIVHNIADDDEKNGMISSKDFRGWASESDAKVVIIYNMQLLGLRFGDEKVVADLNFMRDQILAIGKMFVFGVSPYFDLLLSRRARDLYSCILYHFIFQDSEDRTLGIRDFDINELSSDDMLEKARYQELKERIQTQEEKQDMSAYLMCMRSWTVIREYISYQEKDFIAVIADKVDQQYRKKKIEITDVDGICILARTWVNLEKEKRSAAWYEKVLGVVRDRLGEDCKTYADALLEYSNYYRAVSDYTMCERFCDRAVKIYSKNNMKYSPNGRSALQQRAILYRKQSKFDAALEIYEGLLNYQIDKYGEKYYGNASIYNNIGKVYEEQGNLSGALQQYKKAADLLSIAGKQGGQVEKVYRNICLVYLKSDDGSEAWKYIKKAKRIVEDVYGADSSYLIDIYNSMAGVWRVRGRTEKELEYLEKALELIKETHMENSEMAAYVYHNMGRILCIYGAVGKAIGYYNRAISIWIKAYGEKNDLTANSYDGVAHAFYLEADYDAAKKNAEKARNIYASLYGSKDERVKRTEDFLKKIE